MFTDMVGFTALMQEDEHRAKSIRDRHRDALRESIEKHGGEIVQFYGDGTLSVFGSAVEGVNAAVTAQRRLQESPAIPVRIGIHIGDINHDEDGVYGDGVNVAARIQGLSVPGGVLVSGKVFDEIKNHPELPATGLGEFELKNVQRPVRIFAVSAPGLTVPDPKQMNPKEQPKKTIAVLPFVNMSTDPENEFFSDGISEELINALTRIEGLQVTARTSSFAFKGKSKDVRKIGKDLGVSAILEGSVRKAGNRVRITAQLIDTRDGYHIFSKGVRPGAGGHLQDPGRNFPRDRQRAASNPAGKRGQGVSRHRPHGELRGVRLLPQGTVLLVSVDPRRRAPGGRSLPARRRYGPRVRPGLGGHGAYSHLPGRHRASHGLW